MKKIFPTNLVVILTVALYLVSSCSNDEKIITRVEDKTGTTITAAGKIVNTNVTDTIGFDRIKSTYQPGDKFYLRLNREADVVKEYEVQFEGVYESISENLIVCKAPANIPVGSGDSGSPLLTSDGKVAGALCYGFEGNSDVFLARPIDDLLKIKSKTENLKSSQNNTLNSNLKSFKPVYFISGLDQNYIDRIEGKEDFQYLDSFLGNADINNENTNGLKNTQVNGIESSNPVPGNSISVMMVHGDLIKAGATGTISYMNGNSMWAFGHSMLNSNPIAMPVVLTNMITMVNTVYGAFKFSQPTEFEIGAMVVDENWGIKIETDKTPETAEVITKIYLNDTDSIINTHFVSNTYELSAEQPYISQIPAYLTYYLINKSEQNLDVLTANITADVYGSTLHIIESESEYDAADWVDMEVYALIRNMISDFSENIKRTVITINLENCTDCGYYY